MWSHVLLFPIQHMDVLIAELLLSGLGNNVGVWSDRMLTLLDDDPAQHVFIYLEVVIDVGQRGRANQKARLPHGGLHNTA